MSRRTLGLAAALGASLLLGLASVQAQGYAHMPLLGSTAPAFGLMPLNAAESTQDQAIILDNICGIRPGETSGVLLIFVNSVIAPEDLAVANRWARSYGPKGLEVIAISVDPDQRDVIAAAKKIKPSFPLLDDRYGVVQQRYGLPGAPFSFLLDRYCKVLGFSDVSAAADEERLGAALDTLVSGQFGDTGFGD